MQQAELAALRETDRRRQDQMVETLRVIIDMRREMSECRLVLALREQQRRARRPGPEARIPDHQDASRDADSHIYNDRPSLVAKLHQWEMEASVRTGLPRTEGVARLTRWMKDGRSVFNIRGCAIENQVKFASCTLLGCFELEEIVVKSEIRNCAVEPIRTLLHSRGKASDNKRQGLDDSSRNNMVSSTATLQEAECRQSLQYGDRRKEALWGISAQMHQVPSSPQWPVHPAKGNGAAPKGNGCFECGAPGHFKRDLS
ncbi:hypothetical protein Tco_0932461 [Tanacetum coccineum]